MRYGQIRQYDIANGEGIRTSIFVTGCTHCCYNCFNEEYQNFNAGKEWTQSETDLVVSYSGYTIDDILEDKLRSALLHEIDILVDGRFVDELKDPALRFRGSSNQRIIDVKKTLETGEVVLAME